MAWHKPETRQHNDELVRFLSARQLEGLDLFDRAQLAFVIDVCKRSRSLSEAGRTLFGASRARKSISNDADRLRKYLGRFGLEFSGVHTPTPRAEA